MLVYSRIIENKNLSEIWVSYYNVDYRKADIYLARLKINFVSGLYETVKKVRY